MHAVENTQGLGCFNFDTALIGRRHVVAAEIDELGHVNNSVYIRWVQDMAVHHWSLVAPKELQQRVLFVVLRHEVDYRDAAELGDEIEIRTWLGKASGPRFERHVDIRKKGAAKFSAKALTTWCMLDRQSRKPLRVGDDVLEIFGLDAERIRSL